MDNLNEELYHWGIKGMKWGIRRFQNKDGSLTQAGRKRRREELEAEDVEKKKDAVIKSRSAKQLYDNANLFTTQELQQAYNRLELEKKIKDIAPKEVTKGEAMINKLAKFKKNVSSVVDSTTGLYNSTAKLYNTFSKDSPQNEWANIRKREASQAAKARKEAKERADKAAQARKEAKADREAKKELNAAKKFYEKKEKEFRKEDSKLKEYEIFTGKVEGDGTSRSNIKAGKQWTKEYDYEIDFTTFSNPSPATQQRIESGAHYVAGLLEDLTNK